jgi:hypothetical protein
MGFLFYGRAIDCTMLVALGALASQQSNSTKATAKAITQLINYAAAHPDTMIQYIASDMYLHIHSDASVSFRSASTQPRQRRLRPHRPHHQHVRHSLPYIHTNATQWSSAHNRHHREERNGISNRGCINIPVSQCMRRHYAPVSLTKQ